MLRIYLAIVFLALCHSGRTQSAVEPDSLVADSLMITPHHHKVPAKSMSTYAFSLRDRDVFHTYAGLNILNTLRGYVPNLQVGADPMFPEGGGRSIWPLLVIDGLPYASNYGQYYNLNTFEFQEISVVSSAAGIAAYGSPAGAAGGGVFLQSKTGQGHVKPLVEFNTFPSYIAARDPFADRWQFTNALAYAQDFGKVDTRISLNSSYLPVQSGNYDAKDGLHFLKINTGVEVLPRLSARIVVDGMYNKGHSESTWRFGSSASKVFSDKVNLNGVANLKLNYRATDWLTINSQSSLGSLNTDLDTDMRNFGTTSRENRYDRRFVNLFARGQDQLMPELNVSLYSGAQVDHRKRHIAVSGDFVGESTLMLETRSFLSGATLSYKNVYFVSYDFRYDKHSSLPDNHEQSIWSLGGALLFSELVDVSGLDFGKVRIAAGRKYSATGEATPSDYTVIRDYRPEYTAREPVTMFEAGTDLSFINRRLGLNLTYFHDISNTSGQFFTDKLHTSGWEVALSTSPVQRENVRLRTIATWARPNAYFGTDTGSNPDVVGTTSPEWSAGLLNQLHLGNFFVSMLVDAEYGGQLFSFTGMVETTNVELRDISIAYQVPLKGGTAVNGLRLSASSRNLWAICEESPEISYWPRPNVTSISLTVGF